MAPDLLLPRMVPSKLGEGGGNYNFGGRERVVDCQPCIFQKIKSYVGLSYTLYIQESRASFFYIFTSKITTYLL
jgi:hypothetical protein